LQSSQSVSCSFATPPLISITPFGYVDIVRHGRMARSLHGFRHHSTGELFEVHEPHRQVTAPPGLTQTAGQVLKLTACLSIALGIDVPGLNPFRKFRSLSAIRLEGQQHTTQTRANGAQHAPKAFWPGVPDRGKKRRFGMCL
jgi:hypothetical protein